MSWDISVMKDCPHRVVDERYFLESDRKTIRFNRQPRSRSSVEVRINEILISKDKYSFEEDELIVDGGIKIVLKEELKEPDPLIQLSYDTERKLCRRCHGLGREFDFGFASLGKLDTVKKEEKLVQDCIKWVFTELGSDLFADFIGTRLSSLIGTKNLGASFLKMEITSEIRSAIERLRKFQIRQLEYQVTNDEETIDAIRRIDVVIDPFDPTVVNVDIELVSLAGRVVEIQKTLKVPVLKKVL